MAVTPSDIVPSTGVDFSILSSVFKVFSLSLSCSLREVSSSIERFSFSSFLFISFIWSEIVVLALVTSACSSGDIFSPASAFLLALSITFGSALSILVSVNTLLSLGFKELTSPTSLPSRIPLRLSTTSCISANSSGSSFPSLSLPFSSVKCVSSKSTFFFIAAASSTVGFSPRAAFSFPDAISCWSSLVKSFSPCVIRSLVLLCLSFNSSNSVPITSFTSWFSVLSNNFSATFISVSNFFLSTFFLNLLSCQERVNLPIP